MKNIYKELLLLPPIAKVSYDDWGARWKRCTHVQMLATNMFNLITCNLGVSILDTLSNSLVLVPLGTPYFYQSQIALDIYDCLPPPPSQWLLTDLLSCLMNGYCLMVQSYPHPPGQLSFKKKGGKKREENGLESCLAQRVFDL